MSYSTLATVANMRRFEEQNPPVEYAGGGTVRRLAIAWSFNTGEEFSATSGDYFNLAEDVPLEDRNGDPMFLVVRGSTMVDALGAEAGPRQCDEPDDRAEHALTQVQHIAYEALVRVEGELAVPAGRLTAKELRQLARYGKEALSRINSIAEGGAADPEFVAMLAKANE